MEEARGSSTSSPRIGTGSGTETAALLANVEWIVTRLDQRGLAEINDVPVLELAKHISVGGSAT
jgi:hypothetical protein